MQLGAGMAATGQATASETVGAHVEISAVLLHQKVCGGLGHAKEAVGAVIDTQVFINAPRSVWMVGIDGVPSLQFHQGQAVGSISIHLVGAQVDKDRLGTVGAGGFQQDEGAVGVDREVGARCLGGPVMGRLGCAVHDEFNLGAMALEKRADRILIPNAQVGVAVVGQALLELSPVPVRAGFRAEESGPHVVVDSDDGQALFMKEPGGLAANQSGGSSDDDNGHGDLA
jgi:hypothetical protein